MHLGGIARPNQRLDHPDVLILEHHTVVARVCDRAVEVFWLIVVGHGQRSYR
jgi:hypothetical protein